MPFSQADQNLDLVIDLQLGLQERRAGGFQYPCERFLVPLWGSRGSPELTG
jgi:hypothetical protein